MKLGEENQKKTTHDCWSPYIDTISISMRRIRLIPPPPKKRRRKKQNKHDKEQDLEETGRGLFSFSMPDKPMPQEGEPGQKALKLGETWMGLGFFGHQTYLGFDSHIAHTYKKCKRCKIPPCPWKTTSEQKGALKQAPAISV